MSRFLERLHPETASLRERDMMSERIARIANSQPLMSLSNKVLEDVRKLMEP